MDPLEITSIWQQVNHAGGALADCVKKQRGPIFPIRDDLAEAEALLSKATVRVRQLLANRDLK
jgi:uncharacterized protein with PhoU and TrkA domain